MRGRPGPAFPAGSRAIVGIAALDVRRAPDHRAELTSQLLLGEVVRVLRTDRSGAWLEVRNRTDGYRGWVRGWGLVRTTPAGEGRWLRQATGRVLAPWVEARSRPRGGWLVTPLFWQSRVIAGPARAGRRLVTLPDGRSAWVPAGNVTPGTPRIALARRVQDLMGVPYLWGGRTAMGLDCSGLVQLLLAEQGVALPRDTGDQIGACRRLESGEGPAPGDLLFFRNRSGEVGHVGIGLGEGYFAHARGVVRVNSSDASNPVSDSELNGTEVGWFRVRVPRAGARGRS